MLPQLLGAILFYLTAFAFVFGLGALPLLAFERQIAVPERTALACAIGLAIAPFLLCVLAVCHAAFVFAPMAIAVSIVMAVRWLRARAASPADEHGDMRWYILLPAVVFAIAAFASAGRMTTTSDGISIFGDYETFDLTYYASIAAELAHTTTIPPLSPFYAGSRIIYSYFSLIFLAAVQSVTPVTMLHAFLAYGWPFYTSVAAAAVFAFCRRLGSAPFAALSTLLVFTGSSLAYLAAWFSPDMVQYDQLIWSSMFLAPSAEWLYFNPWAPTLAVTAAGLYAMTRTREPLGRWWAAIASFCFGSLFMFKSFSFPVVIAALGATAVVHLIRRDRSALQIGGVAAGAVVWALPWIAAILPHNQAGNRGALLKLEWLWLVRRMLLKTNLTGSIESVLEQTIGLGPNAYAILAVATVIFLAGGLGTRWLGIVPLWRAAIGRADMRPWTPLAWIVIVGVALSFAITVAPFPNSIQTYMFGLFAMWPFAAFVIWPRNARASAWRWIASAVLLSASVPATVHYVVAAHAAADGAPLTAMDQGDFRIVRYLQRLDVDPTLLLHSNPLWPSLYAIEAQRRVVLGWSSYVEGDGNPDVDALEAEIARFFGSPDAVGANDVSLLKRFGVTHVIERPAKDQLHPHVVRRLRLVTGTPNVRLYEVPRDLAP